MLISELLKDESCWCKFAQAKNKDGIKVDYNDPEAVCFCLWGALFKCYPLDYASIKDILEVMLKTKGYTTIISFNDDETTTYENVISLVKESNV